MLTLILAAGLATASPESCGCAETFTAVAAATEENYAGYQIKLPDAQADAVYANFRKLLAQDAREARTPSRCRELLDAYVGFFDDAHLFVTESATPAAGGKTEAPQSTVASNAPEIPNLAARWTPEKVEFRLRREGNLDPIEGMWRDDEGEFAIVYDEAVPRGEYVAFRFSYRHGTRPGEVIAFIRPNGDGTYEVHYKRQDETWQRARGNLNRQTGILNFGGRGWQRTSEEADDAQAAPSSAVAETKPESSGAASADDVSNDPLAPQFRDLGKGVYYLSLPSFMPRFREPLNALIAQHGETLEGAQGLVIDLRGNSGGDAIYFPLADYLLTGPIVVNEANAVLASDWNIEYFERFREQLGERGAYLDPVLARMRSHRGEIVPYLAERVEAPDTIKPGPKQIVVLQDGGVGSAAEAFLLHFRQSDKVVTMGEPSRGNIDYQQVTMRKLGCGAYEVMFGYPLYMRTRKLPQDSLDDSGVAPDVRLSPAHGDWVQYAERWLRGQ